jgi:hypothetical protein
MTADLRTGPHPERRSRPAGHGTAPKSKPSTSIQKDRRSSARRQARPSLGLIKLGNSFLDPARPR